MELHDSFYIGGRWAAPTTADIATIVSPNTEELIGQVPAGHPGDIDAAVQAARDAFRDPGGWSQWEPARRGAVLEDFAGSLEKRLEAIADRVSMQNGMPITMERLADTPAGPALLRYYAALVMQQSDDLRRTESHRSVVTHAPAGVVAAIVPWNYPQALAFTKVAPALAAGCTVVLKPSPETVLDSYLVAEAAQDAGLPPGVLNIVAGDRDTGAYLVTHPNVDHVAFTGSTAAGRSVAQECGRLLRPATLELGGKSAGIVLEDFDLAEHLTQFYGATLLNNGQTCFLSTRILLPRSRYGELVDLITAYVSGLPIGPSTDEATLIGPLVTQRQQSRVLDYIGSGRESGARLTTGGGRPNQQDRGWFVEPTVFADVDNSARIAREEIFGPVLCLLPYSDLNEAVRIANDSDYGLSGSVWTNDEERGIDIARRMQTGGVGLNGTPQDIYSPAGGVKASGIGRELGPEGLRPYQDLKSVYLPPLSR